MKNSVSPIRNHHFQALEPPEIDQKSTENPHRISDTFFVTCLSKLTSVLTSKMEPFCHRRPLKNGSNIWPRKKSAAWNPCALLPVAPLPPITCSGKPAPKSDNGNVCAEHEHDQNPDRARDSENNCWSCTRKTNKQDCNENDKNLLKHIKLLFFHQKKASTFSLKIDPKSSKMLQKWVPNAKQPLSGARWPPRTEKAPQKVS